MVKWCESWLERQDENGIKLKYWAQKRDNEHARWILCYCDVKFSKSGIHALMQHVGIKKYQMSDFPLLPAILMLNPILAVIQ